MKNLLFLIFAFTFFISCTTSNEPIDPVLTTNQVVSPLGNNNGGGNATTNGTFSVDFDGQTFTANSTQAIVNNSTIAITGFKSDGSFFQITLLGIPTVGTYNNINTNQLALAYSSGSGQIPYLGVAASNFNNPSYSDVSELKILSIDAVNKLIKGSFKFNGAQINPTLPNQLNIKSFTNGQFNLTYTSDVQAPVGNSFFAKLDGAAFNPTNITGIKTSGLISIIGRRGSVENIGVSFADTITAGTTLNLSPFDSNGRLQYILDNNPLNIFGGTGSITIISHDILAKRVKGTFLFNAATLFPPINSKIITDGSFDVTYL